MTSVWRVCLTRGGRRGLTAPAVLVQGLLVMVLAACSPDPAGPRPDPDPDPGDPPAGPDWAHVKAHVRPELALPDEFETPVMQPPATLGWEDGLFISRDGLHLYAFYAPADVFQYALGTANSQGCPQVDPYLRGPQLGMDLTTNPWGCARVLHSDIVHASRSSTAAAFSAWTLSGMANPVRWEGGFQALPNDDGTIDAVLSQSTDDRLNDLLWARGVTHDPPISAFTPMPDPINSTGQEDNPHLERLAGDTLVLLFDNHGVGDAVTSIRYALSTDDGASWSAPSVLGAPVNAGPHEMHPHLYFDGAHWWLYFASQRSGSLAIYRSRHDPSAPITQDFDRWESPQLVLAPGVVDDGSGTVTGVGEPTLTADGDLSFAVVFTAAQGTTEFNKVEIDPWIARRKR